VFKTVADATAVCDPRRGQRHRDAHTRS
jgi:hypothetical protein